MNWDNYFATLASTVRLKSKDNNTQIGAVIARPDHTVVSMGYNSFPRGIDDTRPERQDRPEKYYWFEHAERNAIYNAARIGVPTDGAIMYLTCGTPCADCARAIINAGIKMVVMRSDGVGAKGPQWEEHAKRSLIMFEEAGVTVRYYSDE